MSVWYYEPFYNWDRLFDDAFSTRQRGQQKLTDQEGSGNDVPRFLKPRLDLHENAENNTVTATFEFPGLNKDDINIDVHNGRLTVSAESKFSADHNHEGYAIQERRFGKFSRTLQLPQGISDEEVKASMENGVLTVTFPKATAAAAPKKITVN